MLEKIKIIKARMKFIFKLHSIEIERDSIIYCMDENIKKLYTILYKKVKSDLLEQVELDFEDMKFVRLKKIPMEKSLYYTYLFYSLLSDALVQSRYYKYVYTEWITINELKIYFQRKAFPKLLMCSKLDFMITEKCSLRCKDCLNLMQYYTKPRNFDKNILKKEIDLLTDKFDEIAEIRILGGEPFMNSDIYEIIQYCQQKDNIKMVTVFTNGTIMPNLNRINNERLLFYISYYGVEKQKPMELIENLKKKNIDFIYNDFSQSKWIKNGEIKANNLNEKGLLSLFQHCLSRKCVTFVEGKIYHCEFVANAERLCAIPSDVSNSVDLTNPKISKEQLIDYLFNNSFLDGCRWCSRAENITEFTIPGIQISKPVEYLKMEN